MFFFFYIVRYNLISFVVFRFPFPRFSAAGLQPYLLFLGVALTPSSMPLALNVWLHWAKLGIEAVRWRLGGLDIEKFPKKLSGHPYQSLCSLEGLLVGILRFPFEPGV